MNAPRASWWSSHGRECLVFGLAVGLAGVWAFGGGEDSRAESLRHLYAVNALAASLWGVVSGPIGRPWTTLRVREHPEAPVVVGRSRFTRQTLWATGLWIATSALFPGWNGVTLATTWVVLLCSLLVLGGLPLALEVELGFPRAQLLVLGLATFAAAAVLGLSVIEPRPWPVRLWSLTPVKLGVAASLLAVHAVSGIVTARSHEGSGRPSP